jgi:hypothetical protein
MKKTTKTKRKSILCKKYVRYIITSHGKQAKPEFLDAFERFVNHKLKQAIETPNGRAKRLDASIAGFVFGNF